MPVSKSWNKGYTKFTHPSVRKTSETMKKKKIDNFAQWRKRAIEKGVLKVSFPPLKKNGDLAELIGVILGDGHIEKFPRTERLLIFSNASNKGFVKRYTFLVEKVFSKSPYVYKQHPQECIRISLYQKKISRRLGVPTGSRKDIQIMVPKWVLSNRKYIVRYLRGLFEAEGSFSVHIPTSTFKFSFANHNQTLLAIVADLLRKQGFHPSRGNDRVQLSRKKEVMEAMKLLKFRKY